MGITVLGTGSDLPEWVVTNDDIEQMSSDYSRAASGVSLDGWVKQRAGVTSRHRLAPGEGTSDMAERAARRALADAGVEPAELDLVVMATFTSDYRLPSSVSLLQRSLGTRAKCLQLESACTGFLDGMAVATSMMRSAGYRTVLLVAAEAMSSVVDDQTFMYQSIFGDGAGAVVLRDLPGTPYGLEALVTHTDATNCDWTWAPGGGTKAPITADVLADRSHLLSLDHRAIYRFAVEKLVESTHEVLAVIDQTVSEVDWLIPHQTGRNIIDDMVEQLKIDEDRVVVCLDHTGNTSGASVAIALDEARRSHRLQTGQRIVLSVVGGGMAWGAASLVWRDPGTTVVA